MEQIEICSVASSDSSDTIIDEHLSTKFASVSKTGVCDTKESKKNIYDLSESEGEDIFYERPFCQIDRPLESRQSNKHILEELSQKYLSPSLSQPHKNKDLEEIVLSDCSGKDEGIYLSISSSQPSKNEDIERIVLSDSSSEEDEPNNGIDGNNVKNLDFETSRDSLHKQLEGNNTVFENFEFCESTSTKNHYSSEDNYLTVTHKRLFESVFSSSDEESNKESNSGNRIIKKSIQKRAKSKEEKRITAEEKKSVREKEKSNKKEQLQKEKTLKQAQKAIDKSHKPEECLKNMIVNMDDTVFNSNDYGDCLKDYLRSKEISYRMRTSFPGMISWSRQVLTIQNLAIAESESQEKHFAVVIKPGAFGNLISCIQSIKEQINFKHLSIFVYGQSKPTSAQEDEIMDIELIFPTYWQFVKDREELSSFLFMLTKSIAQIPYKLQQEEKFKQNTEYFEDCNKNLVKVDKNGNGLGMLWRQMLTMFPLVRLEAAEAITAAYPTPDSLFQAYKNCTENGEQLIQELPVRRTQGPLGFSRRLGPELSKKCFRFFTSEENSLI